MFADLPGSPSIDTAKSIAFAHQRLLSLDVAMLEGWVQVVRARVVEDCAKVNESLFVEAWQVHKRGMLRSQHGLSAFMSFRENVDMNWPAVATQWDAEDDVDIGEGWTPTLSEVLAAASEDLW